MSITDDRVRFFTQDAGKDILRDGTKMIKRPNPVFVLKQDNYFAVDTAEGVMRGNPGDYVVYDPISGHVWVIKEDYLKMHYRAADDQPRAE